MPMLDRRQFLQTTAAAAAATLLPRVPAFAADDAAIRFVKFPEKTDLILLTDRPPQLETPLKYFLQDLTPNDAFFVRWHLALIPTSIDEKTFRLVVKGHVDQPLSLSLDELRKGFEPASVVAVNQCSGNSRSFFEPRIPGGQWGNGAMGNAKWTGVKLSDLLKKAGMKAGAVDVSFQGLDRAPLPSVPNFVKSLSADHANDGEVIVAYAMNDKPLPMLNGYPLRLIVPGWFGTYWVKSLNEIAVLDKKFSGFWMDKSYRITGDPHHNESPTDLAKDTVSITKMVVRSVFVTPEPGAKVSGQVEVQGLAFDGGSGIAKVEVSTDAGKTWAEAKLDPDLGKYSWRRWRFDWKPAAGQHQLQCRATSTSGENQVDAMWNRSGYARNVIEKLDVTVS
jgi:DMSO/TMAO reductase YedYZ molybdopterin-dependent catalytic subunit